MIMTICLSATIQKTVSFCNFNLEQVNRSKSYRFDASGKAVNSARVLNQLEKNTSISILPLGEENSEHFQKLAQRDNLIVKSVKIPGYTRECITIINENNHTTTEVVVDEPDIDFNRETIENDMLKLIEENLKQVNAVIVSGSQPKYFSSNLQSRICKLVKENNKTLLVDFHGDSLLQTLKVCSPDFIKINEEEYLSTFALPKKISKEEFSASLIEQSSRHNSTIIITRGTESTIYTDSFNTRQFPVTKITPVNTTACGDSFNAGFLYEYLKTNNLEKAVEKGTYCATQNALSLIPGSIF